MFFYFAHDVKTKPKTHSLSRDRRRMIRSGRNVVADGEVVRFLEDNKIFDFGNFNKPYNSGTSV